MHNDWQAQNISRVAFGNVSLFLYRDNVGVADVDQAASAQNQGHGAHRCCSHWCWEPSPSGAGC
jgi:hypothetical protein